MYVVKHGSGRYEPIENEVFTSDWEIGNRIMEMIENQELEPDGNSLPETLDFIEDTSEMEIDVYWADHISNDALYTIDAMWEHLTELWEDEANADKYDKALTAWRLRINDLSA